MDPITIILLGLGAYGLYSSEKESDRKAIYQILYSLVEAEVSHRRDSLQQNIINCMSLGNMSVDEYLKYENEYRIANSNPRIRSEEENCKHNLSKAIERIDKNSSKELFESIVELATNDSIISKGVYNYLLNLGAQLGVESKIVRYLIAKNILNYSDSAVAYLAIRGMCDLGGVRKEGVSLTRNFLDNCARICTEDQKSMLKCFVDIPKCEEHAVLALNNICNDMDDEFIYDQASCIMYILLQCISEHKVKYWYKDKILRYSTGRFKIAIKKLFNEIEQISAGEYDSSDNGRFGETNSIFEAFHTLGLEANATWDEVKSSFRELSMQFHPDKISSKGLNKEFIKYAEKRFREIKTAYDLLRKNFSIK